MNTNTNNYRPALAFYHDNARGTGCAVKMTLRPATVDEAGTTTDGCIWLEIAQQMTVGNRMGPNPTFPRFDWDNRMTAKLDFNDICLILQVLRGETEEINDGKGIYKRTACGLTVIKFRHIIDPVSGYSLELYATHAGGGEESRAHFLMSPAEALGICEAFTGSMRLIAFGE